MKTVNLNGENLTFEQVVSVALNNALVEIDTSKLAKSRQFIVDKVKNNEVVYGVTTGFGANVDKIINLQNAEQLQVNLLRSHACGIGEGFPKHIVRAIMLIRLNTLLKGFSGVQTSTVEQIKLYLNKQIHPLIPQQGSVGASGDLCPLAHMALPLIGESYAEFEGKTLPTTQILSDLNLAPITLSYKEGLGLINGTTVMAALGVFAIYEFNRLLKLATLTSCLAFEAIGARREAFDEKTHKVRGNKAQIEVASRIRKLTADSTFIGISPERLHGKFDALAAKKSLPQDAYSIRCLPQVFGASLQALHHAEEIFACEINAAVDNPLIFADENEVLSGGNFHGQPVALVLDYLKLAVAEIGNITERQVNKLVDKNTNDLLEGFLIFDENHINSGLMIPQYAAASLVSENKVLVHPASADSIPTGGNVEDHVSMGTIAGRQALEIIGNVKKIIAIQLITAHHAAALRQKQYADRNIEANLATATKALFDKIKSVIGLENDDYLYNDRFLFDDINAIIKNYDEFADLADE